LALVGVQQRSRCLRTVESPLAMAMSAGEVALADSDMRRG